MHLLFLDWLKKMRCIGSSYELGYIRQDGTLCDYINRFDGLASSVSSISDYHLPGIFINGLRQELQSEVRDGLKYLRVIDLKWVKKLVLVAEEKLTELDRLAELRKRRMISSRKTERSRAGNGFAYQSNVRGLDRIEEDPWKKLDSMLEKMQKMIKGSNTNSEIHTDATTSLQEASTGLTPLVESNGKKSENLPNSRPGKFKQLSVVDFQFRSDKGICFRCDKRFHPNHVCQTKTVECVKVGDHVLMDESETSDKTECNEMKSEELDVVESVDVEDEDRAPKTIEFLKKQKHAKEEESLRLVELVEKDNESKQFVIPHAKKLEVPFAHFLDFVGGSVVFGSVLFCTLLNQLNLLVIWRKCGPSSGQCRSSLRYPLMRSSYSHSHVEDMFFKREGNVMTQGAK